MDNHRKWFVNCVYMDNMRRKRGGSVRDQLVQEGGRTLVDGCQGGGMSVAVDRRCQSSLMLGW